jgi:putative hydrolase of the HAD superfamily
VDSCQVGMRKPNPAIYRLALEQLGGVAPEAAVFLDDFAPNVDAARAVGLHGVVVTEPVAAMADLDAIWRE